MLVEFYNSIHNTSARVRISSWGDFLTPRQLKRLKRSLCGVSGCGCSDESGLRGVQPNTDGFQHDLLITGDGLRAEVDAFSAAGEWLSEWVSLIYLVTVP